jgi:DNA polymerase-3 subunit epsilon
MSGVLAKVLGRKRRELPESLRRQVGRKLAIDAHTAIEEVDYVAFDTELTGLDPKRDSIISIGAVRLRGGRVFPGKVFNRLVQPESELRAASVVVHELVHSDLEDAQRASDVLIDFFEFVGDSVLLGHFVHIDLGFTSRALKRIFGVRLWRAAVDTATLHDWLVDNDPRFAAHHGGISIKKDLFSTATRYGIAVNRAHDALFDAFVAAQLFQRFLGFLPASGVRTVKELLQVAKP